MMKCGVVDIGSNTIRLCVYQCGSETVKPLLNEKETVGLAGYIRDGVLSEEGVLAACRVLSEYRALLNDFGIQDMYAFGTASLRNISNTAEVLEMIRHLTGVSAEVLSGEDEARFSFRGAAQDGGTSSGLLADIGGGSTELVIYENGAITAECSVPLGSLSLFSRQVTGLFPTPVERSAIRDAIAAGLDASILKDARCVQIVAVGGTSRAAVRLRNDLSGPGPDPRAITAAELRTLFDRLKSGNRDALRQILRSAPDRVHTVLPGLMILNEVVRRCGAETVHVSSRGVREGYLLERVLPGVASK